MALVVPGTDVCLPNFGYGCASLMARTSRAESVHLLETAVDAGITHFDVARSYGYGEAESAVGDLLARHRDRVTVATKFGIAPPERTARLRTARAVARRLAGVSPRLRHALRARASRMVEGGRFGIAEARASLERSLGELRTDFVDILLLHDCQPADLRDELLEFLRTRVQAGQVRAFGVATDRSAAQAIRRERPEFAPLVQVPDSVLDPPLAGFGPAVITHSAVAQASAALTSCLADDVRARTRSAALGADVRDSATLARLLLGAAARRNPNGMVLWSSRDPAHIAANARLAREPPDTRQLDALDALVATLSGAPVPEAGS